MNVTLLTEQWEGTGGIQKYLHGLAGELDDVTVEHENLRTRWRWPDWRGTYKRLAKRAEAGELDVLLCGKTLFEGLVGLKLKEKHGVPYIVFTYAMEVEVWRNEEMKKLRNVLTNADRVVYINDVTKQHLKELGVTDEQLLKLPPGVEQRHCNDISQPLIDATLKQYQVQQPYVLSVGRLIERKGFDVLIEAFAQLDQVKHGETRLVIVGDGPELEHLEQCAEEEFVNTSVQFITGVPDKHMPALYAGADAFALTPRELPGDIEGFGIVYLEAAAHGVPSIGTKTGGGPEAVLDGETGLIVPPEDTKAITQALDKLLGDRALKAPLGAAAKRRAQEFTWSNQAALVKTALQDVVS